MQKKYRIWEEKELDALDIVLVPWDRVFFSGDLGVGKTTLIRHLLRKYMENPSLIVRSPTYVYYEKYEVWDMGYEKENLSENYENTIKSACIRTTDQRPPITIFHFDLYRLEDVDTFFSIGWMEIAEDRDSILLIEWPEILGNLIQPTKKISISVTEDGQREVMVEEC